MSIQNIMNKLKTTLVRKGNKDDEENCRDYY